MKTTKQLARELGLLRRKSAPNIKNKPVTKGQLFSYLIVLDFESTCWQDGKFRTQEIIEFPAVLLNTSTGNIESEFQFYVQPQEQPVLSEFCKQLTGITQDQVEDGIPLHFCLKKFVRWLENLKESKGVVFTEQSGTTDKCNLATIVTWSDWDLGVCLYNELRRKQIGRPVQFNSWIDLRATYRKFYSRRPNGLNGALKDLGIDFEGREHSGLHDSRNTARLAYRMIQDGCILNITKTLKGTNIPGNQKYQPIKTIKQLTPSNSPVLKRQKQNEIMCDKDNDLSLDDSLDQAIASSQELDNILSKVSVETPERKRKSRIPVASPKCVKNLMNKSYNAVCSRLASGSGSGLMTKSPTHDHNSRIVRSSPRQCSKLTKLKAKRILPGKFSSSDIYIDPEDQTNVYKSNVSSPDKNKLTEVSVNIPTTNRNSVNKNGKLTPTKTNMNNKGSISSLLQGKLSKFSGDVYHSPKKPNSSNIHSSISPLKTYQLKSQLSRSPQPKQYVEKSKSTVSSPKQLSKKICSPQLKKQSIGSTKALTSGKINSMQFITPSPAMRTAPKKPEMVDKFKTPSVSSKQTSSFKTPSPPLGVKTPSNTPGTGRIPCPTPHCSSSLRTPSHGSYSLSSYSTPSSNNGTFRTPSRTSINITSNPSGMKGTPPLCKCGKRSKRRMAQTPGPNLGRFFFTCGTSNYNNVGEKKGCGFFKWETTPGNRSQSFTQNGTLSKPFVPVFNNNSIVKSTQKKSLGIRSNSLSSFR